MFPHFNTHKRFGEEYGVRNECLDGDAVFSSPSIEKKPDSASRNDFPELNLDKADGNQQHVQQQRTHGATKLGVEK
jgi:hypothetical protein